MAQIKLAEYTFNNSVGDCLPTLTPNTVTMTSEDSVNGTTTTRTVYIDDGVPPTKISFENNNSLVEVYYLKVDNNITSMARMFRQCNRLTYVNTSNWDTSNITSMNDMFYSCNNLISLDTSNFNTSKVTNMESMFRYCNTLTSLDLSSFDTSEVNDMSGVFYNCYNLTSLNISNFDTNNVTDFSYMFFNCSKLTSLDLSSFDTSSVTNMNGMFDSWTSEQKVYISSKWTLGTDFSPTFILTFSNIIAKYKFNQSTYANLLPVFNSNFTDYTTTDEIDTDGHTIRTIGNSSGNLPTSMTFGTISQTNSAKSLLEVYECNTSNITSMGNMFRWCTALTSLNTSNFNTSKVTDMNCMFYYCSSLTSLDVSNFDTSQVTNMQQLFFGCSLLTSLDVSNFNTEKVTTMSYMFNNCSKLTSLDVSKWDTSNVTTMANTFYGCSSLTSLDVSNWNVGNVESMLQMFLNCSSLTSLDASNWNVGNVTNMTSVFQGCSKLTTLNILNWNTGNVTTTYRMFLNCTSLTSLNISNWNVEKITDMSYMFNNCTSLVSLDMSNWNTISLINMAHIFNACYVLEEIKGIEDFNTNNVTSMSNVFRICRALKTINLSKWSDSKVTNMDRMFQQCLSLETLDMSGFTGALSSDYSYLFEQCGKLETLDLSKFHISSTDTITGMFDRWTSDQIVYIFPNRWTIDTSSLRPTFIYKYDYLLAKYTFDNTVEDCLPTITGIDESQSGYFDEVVDTITTRTLVADGELNVTQYSFRNKTSLLTIEEIKINDNVTSLYNIFSGCNKLTTVNTSNWNTTKVISMESAFQNCSMLSTINTSNIDTSNVNNMTNTFYGCSKLATLDVSNWNVDKVTKMYQTFLNCSSLASLDVSNWNLYSVTDMTSAFQGCSKLTTLDVSNWDTSNVVNMFRMFLNCSSLTSLDLSSWNVEKVVNMSNMFNHCSSLTILDLSNFDMTNVTTNTNMFVNCTQLADVGMIYCDTNTVNTVATLLAPTTPVNIYYFDAEEKDLTVVDNIIYNKYVFNSIQLPPHLELYIVGDVKDELDLKTGILTRRVGIDENNQPYVLENETLQQLILNYENSCEYGRVLPTGVCDKYDVVNSLYTQNVTSILLDGENMWESMEELTTVIKFTAIGSNVNIENLNMKGAGGLYCDNDIFPNINDDSDTEHCRVDEDGNKFYIYVDKNRLASPDLIAWQLWLQENPFTLWYELLEPIILTKAYDELDATQARWEEIQFYRNASVEIKINNESGAGIYPTMEYILPSTNNFYPTNFKQNTLYTIYADNMNGSINVGGVEQEFVNGLTITSGEAANITFNKNSGMTNIVVCEGDTTMLHVPYFENTQSVTQPTIITLNADGSKSCTLNCNEEVILRSNDETCDELNLVTGNLIQRIDENGETLAEPIVKTITFTTLDQDNSVIDFVRPFENGLVNLNSDTGLLPTLHYAVLSTNIFKVSPLKPRTLYTLKYPSGTGSFTVGGYTYNINNNSMVFTTPLEFTSNADEVLFSDNSPQNVILLEGNYLNREIPYFKNLSSVINPIINITDGEHGQYGEFKSELNITLRSLPNGASDRLNIITNKLITVTAERSYQEGDEGLENVYTDGVTTVYELENPIISDVVFEIPYTYTYSYIVLSSDGLLPQLRYRVSSSNTFSLDLLEANTTYTLYAENVEGSSYSLGGINGVYAGTQVVTIENITNKLLIFNSTSPRNVMLLKGNTTNENLSYFSGTRSVSDCDVMINGLNGEVNTITLGDGLVLRNSSCKSLSDIINMNTLEVTLNLGEITLDGTEAWQIVEDENVGEDYVLFSLGKATLDTSINIALICDKLKHKYLYGELHEEECIYSLLNQVRICIKKDTIGGKTVNIFKAWLAQNNITFIHKLATPRIFTLNNSWTTMPPTSYINQTTIETTGVDTLKPTIRIIVATTTLEQIVTVLEEENNVTMLALASLYETMATTNSRNYYATSGGKVMELRTNGEDSEETVEYSPSPMAVIYVRLIKKGLKTIEEVPYDLQEDVVYILTTK